MKICSKRWADLTEMGGQNCTVDLSQTKIIARFGTGQKSSKAKSRFLNWSNNCLTAVPGRR